VDKLLFSLSHSQYNFLTYICSNTGLNFKVYFRMKITHCWSLEPQQDKTFVFENELFISPSHCEYKLRMIAEITYMSEFWSDSELEMKNEYSNKIMDWKVFHFPYFLFLWSLSIESVGVCYTLRSDTLIPK